MDHPAPSPFARAFALSAALTLLAGLLATGLPPSSLTSQPNPSARPAVAPMAPDALPVARMGRRKAAAFLAAITAGGTALPNIAGAAEPAAVEALAGDQVPVWLGSGCFWGRQYDFVQLERRAFGRPDTAVTALSGYAGGTKAGRTGLNCYFGGPFDALYETNGQAEVVQVMLDKADLETQFRLAMRQYFAEFQRLPTGQMIRQDPMDIGPAYRSVIGLPGGFDSPLMSIVREENVRGMQLKPGKGNDGDALNVVWVMDTDRFPFYRAERYHQFHRGLGRESFEREYLVDLKEVQDKLGRIRPTGCPDI